jgi:hypothetical protein
MASYSARTTSPLASRRRTADQTTTAYHDTGCPVQLAAALAGRDRNPETMRWHPSPSAT